MTIVHSTPSFDLTPVAEKPGRFDLVVSNPAQQNGVNAGSISNLCFRISTRDEVLLKGRLVHRDIILKCGEQITFEIGYAGPWRDTLSITIDDIMWLAQGEVNQLESVFLTAASKKRIVSPIQTTGSLEGAQRPPQSQLRPSEPGALQQWIDWANAGDRRNLLSSEPLVMVSFSNPDQRWAGRFEQHMQSALRNRHDPNTGLAGRLWSYRNGLRPGESIDTRIVDTMCRARAAVVFLSPDYLTSNYCVDFELPFLLWRSVAQGLELRTVQVTHMTNPGHFVIPGPNGDPISIDVSALADDRVATPLGLPARQLLLAELADNPAEVDRRFAAIANDLAQSILT